MDVRGKGSESLRKPAIPRVSPDPPRTRRVPAPVRENEAYLEGRALELGMKRGREELAREWKAVRRGWYVGGTEFKERMLKLVEESLREARSGSYSGEARRALEA